jgi:hypothetical protein
MTAQQPSPDVKTTADAVAPVTPTTEPTPGPVVAPRSDAANWARPVDRLSASESGERAVDLVRGRRPMGAIQGFGKLWQKTYQIRLEPAGPSPKEVVATWRERFPQFWPSGNRFFAPLTGIAPGEVALLRVKAPGGLKLSTGILVLYADDESFTFMTPEGHMFAGWITFSAFDDGGTTVAQAQVLMRAQDPLSELGLMLGGHRTENRFWEETLTALAAHLGVAAIPSTQVVCVDARRQWSKLGNIRYDVGIRNSIYVVGGPVRWVRRTFVKSR